jgi:hypothetical protein
LRLKHLNVIEMTVPGGETYELDFKSQFQRIMRDAGMVDAVMYEDDIYPKDELDIFNSLRSLYPKLMIEIANIYSQNILGLFHKFHYIIHGDHDRQPLSLSVSEVSRVPRLAEATKIIVAAPICASCSAPSPAKECQEKHHE